MTAEIAVGAQVIGAQRTRRKATTYRGSVGANTLNQNAPCRVAGCDHMTCRWDYDTVNGQVTRHHSREFPSGIMFSSIEFPPGDPRNDNAMIATDLKAAAIVMPVFGNDERTLAQAAMLAVDLVEAIRSSLPAAHAQRLDEMLLQAAHRSQAGA